MSIEYYTYMCPRESSTDTGLRLVIIHSTFIHQIAYEWNVRLSYVLLLKNIDIEEYGIWTEFRADIGILIGGNAWKNSERSWIPWATRNG